MDPRYPIGKFEARERYSSREMEQLIQRIAAVPEKIEKVIQGLSPAQLDTPYRERGWTVRQVVHHVADSHMNAYIRMKWTITEDLPTIKAYNEKAWADTPEMNADPTLSLRLLNALHAKWGTLLKSLSGQDLRREFIHPQTKKSVSLYHLAGLYAWHGEHHLAHITSLKENMKW